MSSQVIASAPLALTTKLAFTGAELTRPPPPEPAVVTGGVQPTADALPAPVREPRAAIVSAKASIFRLREIALALLHDDRLVLDEVAHADLAGGHARQCPVTAVVGEPGRPAHGRRGEAADGAVGAVARPPQVLDRAMLVLRGRGDPRVPGRFRATLELATGEIEVRELDLGRIRRRSRGHIRLHELEHALVEVGDVEVAGAVVDDDLDTTLTGVDDRAVPDLGRLRQRHELLRAGLLDQDDSADEEDVERLAGDRVGQRGGRRR